MAKIKHPPKVEKQKRLPSENVTIRDRQFFDALIGPAEFVSYKAYHIVHPKATMETARSQAPRMMRKIQPMIKQFLDEEGLSDTALKTKLIQLMNAKETKFFAHEGIVIETREVEALSIQTKNLELAMKNRGMLSEKSAREVEQIDQLIEIELEKLALARQGGNAGAIAKAEPEAPGQDET
jgi:hypothetical protein